MSKGLNEIDEYKKRFRAYHEINGAAPARDWGQPTYVWSQPGAGIRVGPPESRSGRPIFWPKSIFLRKYIFLSKLF